MDRSIIRQEISGERRIRDHIDGVELGPVHNPQPRQSVLGDHNRHTLGVNKYPGYVDFRVVAVRQRLCHLLIADSIILPDVIRDEYRDMLVSRPAPFYRSRHIRLPSVTVEWCYCP